MPASKGASVSIHLSLSPQADGGIMASYAGMQANLFCHTVETVLEYVGKIKTREGN